MGGCACFPHAIQAAGGLFKTNSLLPLCAVVASFHIPYDFNLCPWFHSQHELQIMARLDHPNIVRVYGGCMSPPNLFVVEEIMVGDLASHVHRRGGAPPLTLQQVMHLALDIIKGLVRGA